MTAFIQLKTRPSCVDKIGKSSASHRPTCASSYQNDSELRRHGERSAANHARHAPTQRSSLRNKLVAEAFYLTGNIEKYGSGFIRIRRALQDYPEVQFDVQEFQGGVMATFAQKHPVSPDEGVSEGVNSLMQLIRASSGLRTPALAEALHTSPKNIERWLKQLKENGLIEFRGATKTGGYHAVAAKPAPPKGSNKK